LGATAPGSTPKPGVANSRRLLAVDPVRFPEIVYVLVTPFEVAWIYAPLVTVSPEPSEWISMNCTLPSWFENTSTMCHR